jgi:hypothetical protein
MRECRVGEQGGAWLQTQRQAKAEPAEAQVTAAPPVALSVDGQRANGGVSRLVSSDSWHCSGVQERKEGESGDQGKEPQGGRSTAKNGR